MTQASPASTSHGLRGWSGNGKPQDSTSCRYHPFNLGTPAFENYVSANIPREAVLRLTTATPNDSYSPSRPDVLYSELLSRLATLTPAPDPQNGRSRPKLNVLQEWEGHVYAVEDDKLSAQLIDMTADSPDKTLEADIPLAEISEHDADNLTVGSVFHWVIGYESSPEGGKKRISQIIFDDLPRVAGTDVTEGREWARKTAKSINP